MSLQHGTTLSVHEVTAKIGERSSTIGVRVQPVDATRVRQANGRRFEKRGIIDLLISRLIAILATARKT